MAELARPRPHHDAIGFERPGASPGGIDTHFLGRGWSFPPTFDPRTRGVVMVAQDEDVHQSLRILMATAPGERVMQPGYGCGIHRMVFERLDESTLTELRSLIEKAVLFFEVRVSLDAVSFDMETPLEGCLRIRLDYTVRSTNTRHNMVWPLYLDEGRGARGDAR